MNNQLVEINKELDAIDITNIVEYTRKIKNIHNLSRAMVPSTLRDLIIGFDITNVALANCIKFEIQAKAALDNAESIAYLDRAGDYLKEKGIKDTADARKMYVDIDADVMMAKDVVAKTTAMVSLLRNKLTVFKSAHDTLKKFTYADDGGSGNEGF